MSKDSTVKTIGVAVGICLVCSLFVSVAAVKLRPLQIENKQLDKVKNILQVAGLADNKMGKAEIKQTFEARIQPVLIELATGQDVPADKMNDVLNLKSFDIQKISSEPDYSRALEGQEDIAGITRQPLYMIIYQVMNSNTLDKVILPIYGKGLWSTMYAFIALDKDIKTVSGLTFYEHGETPGLGGEVDNPNWKKQWPNKRAFDDDGNLKIEVIKGVVDPSSDKAKHQIDGLSGATLTTRGINHLVQYWLGDQGYGPYLKRLREAH